MKLRHAAFEPEGEGPHPTVLALHGRGANALDLLGLAPYLCDGRVLVLCPQGPMETPIGPNTVGYEWLPRRREGALDVRALLAAVESVEEFLAECSKRYPVDPARLALLGFSQGGVLAYTLGLSRPAEFAAVVAISTWLPEEAVRPGKLEAAQKKPSLLVQHGSRDELIDVERARASVERLRELRLPMTYREYDIGHEISARSLADLSVWLEEKLIR